MYAIREILRRPGRSLLTALGISFAIGLTFCILSLSSGIDTSIEKILDEKGVDIYVVPKGTPIVFQDIFPPLSDGRKIADSLMSNENISTASPILVDNIVITSTAVEKIENMSTEKYGPVLKEINVHNCIARGRIPLLYEPFGGEIIVEGKGFSEKNDPFYQNGTYLKGADSPLFTHEIMLDGGLAEILDADIGDTVTVGSYIPADMNGLNDWINDTIPFVVVGIMKERYEGKEALSCVLHLSELQYLKGMTRFDSVSKIYVKTENHVPKNEIVKWIMEDSPYQRDISAYSDKDYSTQIGKFTSIMKTFGSIISIISGSAALLFTMTVVVISVKKRESEIGIMKSLGISSRTIMSHFLIEVTFLCLISSFLGMLFGIIGNQIVEFMVRSSYDNLPPAVVITRVTASTVIIITFITFTITLISSLIPTYIIGRTPPIASMREK